MTDQKNSTPESKKSFMELVTDWERGFDALANELMGNETYSAWMNQLQKTRLQAQQSFGDIVSQQLVALNVPTRDDVVRLAEAVRKMDRRLERIESAISSLVPAQPTPAVKRPRRTRKPDLNNTSTPNQKSAQKTAPKKH